MSYATESNRQDLRTRQARDKERVRGTRRLIANVFALVRFDAFKHFLGQSDSVFRSDWPEVINVLQIESFLFAWDSEIHDLFDILTGMTSRYGGQDAFWASAPGSLCFERFCRTFFKWYCPLTVEERHHLPDGPFLLCSNHTSHADSAALMTASGRSFRSFALIGASDYFFRSRSVRWAVSPLMNVIPIDREPGAKSLSACLTSCRRFMQRTGGSIILYPEGTRSPDGGMRVFKSGAILFALELAVPVVPAYIEGTHFILPKGYYVPRAGRVTVRFGEPIEFARPQRGEIPRERRRRAVERLTESIRSLSSRHEAKEFARGFEEKDTASQLQ